jgi:hypothetical protein
MKIIQDDTRPLPANDQENNHQNRPRSLPNISQLISCSKEKSDLKMNIIQEEAGLIPSKKIINKGA